MVANGTDPPATGNRIGTGSVRLRTAAVAVLVVGAALLTGSIALVSLLDRTLINDVRASAVLRAEEVSAVLEASDDPGGLAVADVEEQLIQVLDRDGAVIAASDNVVGRPPVAALRPGESRDVDDLLDDAPFLVVAAGTTRASGEYTVLVAHSLEDANDTVRAVAALLAVGLPPLLVVVGATTWMVVGRALAPVDAIRREVEEISGAQLHRRVPVPPGSDEIGRLARTMNAMLRRLDDAAARQHRFVSDASHELRSPVTSIRQHAEVALAHPESTSVSELAETVLAEDLRVQRLVEDLLLLARSDEASRPLRRSPVDLDDLVYDEARRLHAATGLAVDTTGVGAGRVCGVPSQLGRMIANLVDNAARHARSRVTLGLVSDVASGQVVLVVQDDGAGIPVEQRARVFERFVRLDEARARDHGGSGLGLAIVADVASGHGGTVHAGAAPGGGARFEVRLPLRE